MDISTTTRSTPSTKHHGKGIERSWPGPQHGQSSLSRRSAIFGIRILQRFGSRSGYLNLRIGEIQFLFFVLLTVNVTRKIISMILSAITLDQITAQAIYSG